MPSAAEPLWLARFFYATLGAGGRKERMGGCTPVLSLGFSFLEEKREKMKGGTPFFLSLLVSLLVWGDSLP